MAFAPRGSPEYVSIYFDLLFTTVNIKKMSEHERLRFHHCALSLLEWCCLQSRLMETILVLLEVMWAEDLPIVMPSLGLESWQLKVSLLELPFTHVTSNCVQLSLFD